ncbi:MAG: gamma-glutamylcyclotransferase [Firmicutes bacterium]|nr:gamma-glutamylcyclotransferase [Bacillota bacterium]
MLYFAYGSCMDETDFARTCPAAKKRGRGVLKGYRLRFNGYSGSRKGGIANIERKPREEVYGVLWEVTPAMQKRLDRREGAPWFYRRIPVQVVTEDGERVRAFTYELVRPYLWDVRPHPHYLHLLMRSAPEEAVSAIFQILRDIRGIEMEADEVDDTCGREIQPLAEAFF